MEKWEKLFAVKILDFTGFPNWFVGIFLQAEVMHINRKKYARVVILAAISGVTTNLALAAPPSSNYKIVYADEFSGTSLDTMKWNYNYSWGRTHNHRAYTDPSQVIVSGGNLNLQNIAQRHPDAPSGVNTSDFGWQSLDYTTGAINSSGKFNMTRGYVEARMKTMGTLGTWPAFWMLSNGWPPEIDIMEFPRGGSNQNTQWWWNYHYTNSSGNHASYGWQDSGPDLTAGFHTFGVEWTSSQMKFSVDGTVYHTINDSAAIADATNMYFILNNAVGGWAGNPSGSGSFPSNFWTDYVRVYQLPSSTSATTTLQSTASSGSWDTAANWTVQVPKYEDVTAVFRSNNNAALSLTWNNTRAVGGLLFDSTTTNYTIGTSSGSLEMTKSSGNATIDLPSTNTMDHVVASRISLYDSTTITNNSANSLTISGIIVGAGDLGFEGTGTTYISNNNTYTGDTYIDNGTQGPAVVRVTRSRPFGTEGTLIFNGGGNNTSGRVEIQDNRDIPNNVSLSGRNNATPAFQNISGTNTLSGTITIGSGGTYYILQSDSGLLHLNAAATTNGISITSGATGSRTITLQGAGNGQISGTIQNGSATLNLLKQGAGIWTLSGASTYSGSTTVAEGKLITTSGIKSNSPVTIGAGAVFELAENGTSNGASRFKSLSIALNGSDYTGRLELHDNDLVLDYTGSPSLYTQTIDQVRSGLQLLGGNGYGITSQQVDLQSLPGTMLAVVDGGDPSINGAITSLSGYVFPNPSSSVLVKYTWFGDSNLDGLVDGSDYALIDTGSTAGGTLTGWVFGDYDYSGAIDQSDYALIDTGFISQSGMLPEPSVFGLVLLGAGLITRRTRSGESI